jgi:hypothetical protein
MKKRGTVKPKVLAKLEKEFGDLSKYVKRNKKVRK